MGGGGDSPQASSRKDSDSTFDDFGGAVAQLKRLATLRHSGMLDKNEHVVFGLYGIGI